MGLIARRVGHGIALLFVVSVLAFFFVELAPGDYFDGMRLDPNLSPETADALRSRYGLDRPLPERYGRWLTSVLRGEWGFSFSHNSPVAPLLRSRAGNTLLLTGLATALAWLAALGLGAWAAISRRRWVRRAFGASTSALLAVPELVLALGLLLFAVRTGSFPAGGMTSVGSADLGWGARWADRLHHLVLPVTALALGTFPLLARHVYGSLSEALHSPFLRAARGFGLSRRRLLLGYALPAAANPLISLFGFSIGSLLSASLLVEVVMGWPGLGPMLLAAILARDVHLSIAAVLLTMVLLVLGNLLADLLLLAVDPRVRGT